MQRKITSINRPAEDKSYETKGPLLCKDLVLNKYIL